MSELELFDYTFWLGADEGGVQEALVVRGKPDEDTARGAIPEAQRARITASDERPARAHINPHDVQLLGTLIERPEWRALRHVAKHRMNSHFRGLARMFATEGVELDYDRLQYQRGVFAGMKFVLDEPHRIANPDRLRRLLNDEEVSE